MHARLNKLSLAAIAALLLCLAFAIAAQALQPVPPLTGRVVDLTGSLNPEQSAGLDARLRDFEHRKGSQLAILIVPATQPEAIEQFSIRVAEQWKVGRKNIDDGAILVIAKNERTLRIEVGYGLEGVLNDATCKRIIDDLIVPYFKNADFYGGISAGIDAMMKAIDGEPLPEPSHRNRPAMIDDSLAQAWPLLLVIALALSRFARGLLGPLPGALVVGGLLAAVSWMLLGIVFIATLAGIAGFVITLLGPALLAQGGRHGYGEPYRGGGDFGGGGFRGGGGGFGGGGASGRW